MPVDPFTSAYRALVSALEDSAYVTAIVAADNMLDYDASLEPEIEYRLAGDCPCMFITPRTGGSPDDLWHTSGTAMASLVVDVDVWTGDERLAEILHPLRFAILRALYNAGTTLGNEYVVRSDPASGWAPLTPGDQTVSDRVTQGWGARLSITLELRIPHDEL